MKWSHCRPLPFQPKLSTVYSFFRHGTVVESRAAAMSGIIPITKNVALTIRYVLMANTSHTSGDRKFGHSSRWFG